MMIAKKNACSENYGRDAATGKACSSCHAGRIGMR